MTTTVLLALFVLAICGMFGVVLLLIQNLHRRLVLLTEIVRLEGGRPVSGDT